ncbi:SpaA isopeptide-forming pilin-related protein [Levilactobacillus cerevisiae]|uniref:SpaA isopeptide-forming pilin-related protein n=1 Tax=Levilactobacillus cerevisiae TaxID=1704076 RepID=UPI000F79AAB1|nr:SpaA isopeptide-forming pilin-related protein [Levilactobacillus cerevisiae]
MNFTKLRQLALAALAVCGLVLGGQAIAHASDLDAGTVTMKLHKMENSSNETIQNTGDEVSLPEGVTPYDVDKYGAVTYSVYDVTTLFKDQGVISGQSTSKAFEDAREKILADITDGETDPEQLLKNQDAFVKDNGLNLKAEGELKDNKTDSILTFKEKLPNQGFYLIMETDAPDYNLTGISAPMIIGLPLGKKSTIHLYPKNVAARDVDPVIHKVGIDPENPTSNTHVPLGRVEFMLARKGEKEEGYPRKLTTNEQGIIKFGSLDVGVTYVLTEYSVEEHPWYEQTDGKNEKIELEFKVDKNGNVLTEPGQLDAKHFTVDGENIGIVNYLILGGANFKKVKTDTDNGLAGAKFKVQKIDNNGKIFWAVFKDQTFVKWVTDNDAATELTSSSDGTFAFTGVPYVYDQRNGEVTYNLIETQAPAGYALLDKATEIDINQEMEDKNKAVPIENDSYSLPITGGMGIWLFLLIGSILMGGAGYLYYRQRRQQN